MEMPEPDRGVIARKAEIVRQLRAALPGGVIDDPTEVRAYESDALHRLPLPAAGGGAARLDRGGRGGDAGLPRRAACRSCRAAPGT